MEAVGLLYHIFLLLNSFFTILSEKTYKDRTRADSFIWKTFLVIMVTKNKRIANI